MEKNAHGKRDLLTEMARIEVESRVDEGEDGFDPSPTRRRPSGRIQPAPSRHRVAGRDG